MVFEDIFAILKALVTGKKGLIEVVAEDPRLILIPFIMSALALATGFFRHKDGPKTGPGVVAFCFAGLMALALVFLPGPKGGSKPDSPRPGDTQPPSMVRYETYDDMSISGRNFAPAVTVSGEADCQAKCTREAECKGYIFDTIARTCALKPEPGKLIPFKGSKSGLRQQR